jgi:hypothetical protein
VLRDIATVARRRWNILAQLDRALVKTEDGFCSTGISLRLNLERAGIDNQAPAGLASGFHTPTAPPYGMMKPTFPSSSRFYLDQCSRPM